MHNDAGNRSDEKEQARGRLDEEAGKASLHRAAIAKKIPHASRDPDQPQHGRCGVAEVDCTKPERHEEGRHPFQRVDVRPENSLEIRIARRCRLLHTESSPGGRDLRGKHEITCDGDQRDDCSVVRHVIPRSISCAFCSLRE